MPGELLELVWQLRQVDRQDHLDRLLVLHDGVHEGANILLEPGHRTVTTIPQQV